MFGKRHLFYNWDCRVCIRLTTFGIINDLFAGQSVPEVLAGDLAVTLLHLEIVLYEYSEALESEEINGHLLHPDFAVQPETDSRR